MPTPEELDEETRRAIEEAARQALQARPGDAASVATAMSPIVDDDEDAVLSPVAVPTPATAPTTPATPAPDFTLDLSDDVVSQDDLRAFEREQRRLERRYGARTTRATTPTPATAPAPSVAAPAPATPTPSAPTPARSGAFIDVYTGRPGLSQEEQLRLADEAARRGEYVSLEVPDPGTRATVTTTPGLVPRLPQATEHTDGRTFDLGSVPDEADTSDIVFAGQDDAPSPLREQATGPTEEELRQQAEDEIIGGKHLYDLTHPSQDEQYQIDRAQVRDRRMNRARNILGALGRVAGGVAMMSGNPGLMAAGLVGAGIGASLPTDAAEGVRAGVERRQSADQADYTRQMTERSAAIEQAREADIARSQIAQREASVARSVAQTEMERAAYEADTATTRRDEAGLRSAIRAQVAALPDHVRGAYEATINSEAFNTAGMRALTELSHALRTEGNSEAIVRASGHGPGQRGIGSAAIAAQYSSNAGTTGAGPTPGGFAVGSEDAARDAVARAAYERGLNVEDRLTAYDRADNRERQRILADATTYTPDEMRAFREYQNDRRQFEEVRRLHTNLARNWNAIARNPASARRALQLFAAMQRNGGALSDAVSQLSEAWHGARATPSEIAFAQLLQHSFNEMIKERSGAAVTNSEFSRLMREFGVTTLGEPRVFLSFISASAAALRNADAAFNSPAYYGRSVGMFQRMLERFGSGGGGTSGGTGSAGGGSAPTAGSPPTGGQ